MRATWRANEVCSWVTGRANGERRRTEHGGSGSDNGRSVNQPLANVDYPLTTDATWDRTIAVNLTAPFLLLRAVGPRLAARGGSIVNVSSRAGVMGFADETAYCATKFGVEGLTRAAAIEWRGRPVSINTVTPGARIKPTGISATEFATWPADRRAGYVDPVALGPALVLLATLRGAPSGCRFDLWRLSEAIARDGFAATAARLLDLAETAERAGP